MEKFVAENVWENIPYLFPEDFGPIPKIPSFFDQFGGIAQTLMI